MICRAGYTLYIAIEFDWKLEDEPMATEDPVQSKFDIEMTLTKRRVPKVGQVDTARLNINEYMLKDEAFSTAKFTISFENGRFPVTFGPRGTVSLVTAWFSRRLSMSASPYPSLDNWLIHEAVQDNKFWEVDDFYAEELPVDRSNDG